MKRLIEITLLVLFTVSVSLSAQQVLTLYGSAEPRSVEALAKGFEKANPGVKVNWIRMSSGETLARLRAEKGNPQADAWWGGTTDPHSIAALARFSHTAEAKEGNGAVIGHRGRFFLQDDCFRKCEST